MKRTITLRLFVLLGLGHAQPLPAATNAFLPDQMQRSSIPGVTIAITQGETVLYAKGYGSAGQGAPMTPDTPMYIGSVSKSFTALAAAGRAREG